MTITRINQAGGETGSLSEFDGNLDYPLALNSGIQQTGTYSFRNSSTTTDDSNGYFDIPATRQVRLGVWLYQDGVPSELLPARTFSALGSGNVDLADMKFQRLIDGGDVQLYSEATLRDSVAGGQITGQWVHYGMDVKIDPSSGWVYLYQNGVEVASYTGDTGDEDILRVFFGAWNKRYNCYIYFDDIYVDDTTGEGTTAIPPILRFYHVQPTGAGNYAQFDPSAGNNYECVDEVPPSEGDYVDTATVDEYDSYAMDTITIGTGQTLQAVIPTAYVKRSETTEEIAIGTRYSSTDLVGSDQVPAGSYGMLWERQAEKPGGGAWDQTSLDGFEALIKSRGTY